MKNEIPIPKSKFLKVKCQDCGNEQPVFNKCQTIVICLVCGASLSRPSGGNAEIKGGIIGVMDKNIRK